jgi:hypothetical protein
MWTFEDGNSNSSWGEGIASSNIDRIAADRQA